MCHVNFKERWLTLGDQDQWQRKKQTKEEARAAKMAKLDPDNYKSAQDVLNEQAAAQRKRKREEEGDTSEVDIEHAERPLDSASKKGKKTKKQRREDKGNVSAFRVTNKKSEVKEGQQDEDSKKIARIERRLAKKQRNKEKAEKKAAAATARKERKAQEAALEADSNIAANVLEGQEQRDVDGSLVEMRPLEIDSMIEQAESHPPSTASPSPPIRSPAFDNSIIHSGSSSISSIPPSTTSDLQPMATKNQTTHPTTPQISRTDPTELKNRLQSRIEALRRARKADGPDGTTARNRQELLEARRQKEEARKAHKKELRRKAKDEEARQKAETLARGSPLLSPGSPRTPSSASVNNFSFGRVDFGDGHRASASLDAILEPNGKSKGPSDPRTALLAAQSKQSRLAGLDDGKRADIAEKDVWLNAKKRASGERIRDDTSLLKKTLKRKEKQKKKSEKEWDTRIEGVKKGQDIRQKKRETNLQKRKEEKGNKGKKQKGGKAKAKARPGFEGSFRAKAPSGDGQRRR